MFLEIIMKQLLVIVIILTVISSATMAEDLQKLSLD